MKLHWLLAVTSMCWTESVSRVHQQLWARKSGSRAQHWASEFPCLLLAVQPISAINCRVTKLEEKVMKVKPKQCSLRNRVVIGYKHH